MATIAYARPGTVRTGRTWLIPVTGIACLLVAALSVVVGWYVSDAPYDLHAKAQPPANAIPPAPPRPAPGLMPHQGDVTGERGLRLADRAAVVAAVVGRAPALNPDRRVVLEWLLQDVGADVLQVSPGTKGVPRTDIASKVLDVAQKPDGPDGKRGLGTHVIRTAGGTIALDNFQAKFTTTDGRTAQLLWHGFTDYAGQRMWSSAAIDRGIESAQASAASKAAAAGPAPSDPNRSAEGPVNAMQAAALVAEMRKHAPLMRPQEAANEIPFGTFTQLKGGTVQTLLSNQRTVWLLANGGVAYPNPQQMYDWDPETGLKRWQPPTLQNWLPISRGATGYLIADVYIGYALALALAILGVCLLFDVPITRKLLFVYAAVKILFATAAAVALIRIIGDLSDAMTARQLQPMSPLYRPSALSGRTALAWVVQCSFAFVLIVVLLMPGVRNHYASIGEPSLLPAALRRRAASWAQGRGGRATLLAACALAALAAATHVVLIVTELLGGGAGVGQVMASAGRVAGHIFGACLALAIGLLAWRVVRRSPLAVASPLVPMLAFACAVASAGAAPKADLTVDELVQKVRDDSRKSADSNRLYLAFDRLPSSARGTAAALRLARDDDVDFRRAATKWLSGRASVPQPRSITDDLRVELDATVPLLVARAVEPTTDDAAGRDAWDATEALERIRPDAAQVGPAVESVKTSPNIGVLRRAAQLMYHIKPAPPAVVQAYRRMMRSHNDDVGRLAAQWLARQHRQPAEMLDAARDSEPRARARAFENVYELVLNHVLKREEVEPLLLAAAVDRNEKLREAALAALSQILPSRERQALMVRLFREAPDDVSRENVRHHLYADTPADKAALAANVEAMIDDPNPSLRLAAIGLFGHMSSEYVPYDRLHALVADDTADFDVARVAAARLRSTAWSQAGPVTRKRIESIASVSSSRATTQRFLRDPDPVVPPQTYPPAPAPPAGTLTAAAGGESPGATFGERLVWMAWLSTVVAAAGLGVVWFARATCRIPAHAIATDPHQTAGHPTRH